MPKKNSESLFKRVVRRCWHVIVVVYGLLLILTLVVVAAGLYFAFHGSSPVQVDNNIALVWAPSGQLVEQSRETVRNAVFDRLVPGRRSQSVVRHLVKTLDVAAHDSRINQVLLKLDGLGHAPPGQLQDLVAAIQRFKQSGKRVIAWSPTYDQAQYLLASQADEVIMDPMGYVYLPGYGVYRHYLKDGLDKLGIKVNVFRDGKYKSYVEPFIRNNMSPAARAADRAWLGSLWKTYKKTASQARDIKPEAIHRYIENFGEKMNTTAGDAAQIAVQAGLVDKLETLAQLRADLRAIVGTDDKTGSFRQISNFDYYTAIHQQAPSPHTDSKIALVVVQGDLVNAGGIAHSADGRTIAAEINRVRRNDHVAALVLRVNSPGGSVFAAETIRRAVAATRSAGKPVVVSMAGMAASGGYWISMNANQIWAQPDTITGSIGVFAMLPDVSKTLEKLGIHTDGLGTTPLSGALRPDRPMSDAAKQILQAGIDHAYSEFTHKVAKARQMSVASVDKIAQGRVWSGLDAKRIGLVDKLGGMHKAIAAAAGLAGLRPGDFAVKNMRKPSGWRTVLQDVISARIKTPLPGWLETLKNAPTLSWVQHGLSDPRHIYSYCMCQLSP